MASLKFWDKFAFVNKYPNQLRQHPYFLNHVFKYAFSVAKRVKNETKISEGPTSLAAAAIRVARNINGELTTCNGVIFGLDETAIFLAEQFEQAGAKKFINAEYEI